MFEQPTALPAGAFPSGSALRWAPEDEPVAVSIEYDVIDRLGAAVMEGFSRVPKRGAEIGGILLGSIQDGERPLVRIVDFLPVPVDYRWGPSYQLADDDLERFDSALSGAKQIAGRDVYAVGYFRSHTRETFQMIADDVRIMDTRFPHPSAICLLIRPHRTQVSRAVFLFRRNGEFNTSELGAGLPFRRSALGGGRPERRRDRPAPPPALPVSPTPARALSATAQASAPVETSVPVANQLHEPEAIWVPRFGGLVTDADLLTGDEHESGGRTRGAASPRRRWIAVTYSVVMLLLGLLSGVWLADRYLPALAKPPEAPRLLPLSLAVQLENDEITLSWSLSPVLEHDATGGTLHVLDGLDEKMITLHRADILQRALRFRHAATQGRMKLEITFGDNYSVSESAVWTAAQPAAAKR